MTFDVEKYTQGLKGALAKAQHMAGSKPEKSYTFKIQPPELLPGVVPANETAPVMAMDYNPVYGAASSMYAGGGFPGFAYLSQIATRAEFRAFAAALSTELTREWIEFSSTQNDGSDSGEKIKKIEAEFTRLKVRDVVRQAAAQDVFFGRGQIFIDCGQDRATPLILDPRTVPMGSFKGLCSVEAIWTTPSAYNALDPAAPDFYKPTEWYMLGQKVHASRLMSIVTRELPDILKPAYNFAGISLSQLAERYVDDWLRTKQSVSDLIANFSTTALKTSMGQVLQSGDDGKGLVERAQLFTLLRSNQGLMLMDKEAEDLVQLNVPLGGLHELQAQSLENLCTISRIPAIKLTGISPSGFNASNDNEVKIFYDLIAAEQEAFWRKPLETILKVVQLSLFGEIDTDIVLDFVPLYQLTPVEKATIRLQNAQAGASYIQEGVIDPGEERERLANDPDSGYQGLDMGKVIEAPEIPEGQEGETGEDPGSEGEHDQP